MRVRQTYIRRLIKCAVAEQFRRVLDEPEFERCFRAVVFAILSNPVDAKEKFAPFYYLFG